MNKVILVNSDLTSFLIDTFPYIGIRYLSTEQPMPLAYKMCERLQLPSKNVK